MDIPDPKQILDTKMSQIKQIRDGISAKAVSPSLQRKMEEVDRVEQVYASNAIEGNRLTLRETELVLRGITVSGRSLNEHIEANNLAKAWDQMRSLSMKPLTESAMLDLHAIVLAGIDPTQAGRFRTEGVRITGSRLIPANPASIPAKVTQAFSSYLEKDDIDLISKSADLHASITRIHPFIDGNGRVARLVQSIALNHAGYWPVLISPDDRGQYYEALEKGDEGDPIPYRIFVLDRLIADGRKKLDLLG